MSKSSPKISKISPIVSKSIQKYPKRAGQAGAELGQAQLKLELELIVFVEYTNLPFNTILIWLQIAELTAAMGS